ncbi:hypothetical protein G4X40_01530 [Rhodococcus sp. D2-41]|uniref:DUF308 domain-containing protein n=1 Tax=Speluncibacter jeojiensis TaxID=2710754 RepID=A0A9X4RFG8_9ACTN|nr:DUF308 domain-containing protein [Rhodococcus sp. D2-41]MDG3008825.1 hypothetical protein [Rhodococcus sp. D2-41]MDG3012966.1 DUF308 domain-containing protein [Corynebacteriales bacterium D3-21]
MSTPTGAQPYGAQTAQVEVRYDEQTVKALSGLSLVLGLVTLILGILLVAWPSATLYVLVVLLAIDLFVFGAIQLARAFLAGSAATGTRTLVGIGGALSILLGFLVLRQPLQTVVVIALLIGAWLVVRGVFDIVEGAAGRTASRAWSIVVGIVSIVAGAIVLLQPDLSLKTLVVIIGVWMIVYGILLALAPLVLKRALNEA